MPDPKFKEKVQGQKHPGPGGAYLQNQMYLASESLIV